MRRFHLGASVALFAVLGCSAAGEPDTNRSPSNAVYSPGNPMGRAGSAGAGGSGSTGAAGSNGSSGGTQGGGGSVGVGGSTGGNGSAGAGTAGSGTAGNGSSGAGASAGAGGTGGGSAGATGAAGATAGAGGSGDTGAGTLVSIHTVDIPVPAGAELVKCQNFKNPIGQDAALLDTESEMVSSHHMFVFHDAMFDSDTNSAADCSGIEFHDLLHMAQTPTQDLPYPTGVGRSLKGSEGLRILVHLLNPSTSAVTAHVTVNLTWVAPSQVQRLAVALFANNALLSVPTGMSTQSRTTQGMPSEIMLMQAVSHMHSRATSFIAKTSTGQTIYQGTDWNEPSSSVFNPPMDIKQGTTITWACTYNNTTGMTLTFGESANTNEMCILAGTAYPAQAGVDLGTGLEWVL